MPKRFDSQHTLVRFSELSQYETDPSVAALLPLDYCLERNVVILGKIPPSAETPLTIGLLNPKDQALLAELSARLDRTLSPVQLNAYEIRRALSRIFEVALVEDGSGLLSLDSKRKIDFSDDQSPRKILDDLLSAAVRRQATDIHLECYADDVDLRFRVDGILYQITTPLSPDNLQKVISRIKVLCSLDHAERRRAQDGRFCALYDEEGTKRRVDFRISIVPGPYGQDAVIRLLDPNRFILDLDRLDMSPEVLQKYRRLLLHPNGLILTTGPTGSGKTTTLYASVQTLRSRNIKIVTVEDPIEFEFPKVNQKNVTETMGFPDFLRTFLRQNPDVILVGEIRDSETAEVALRAAMTGHLILSTLHTRDAVGTVGRLRTLGASDDEISNVLVGALGQRLVRRLCMECREECDPPADLLPLFYAEAPALPFFRGRGCAACDGRGYRGLVGIYEIFQPTENVRTAIGEGKAVEEIRALALSEGFEPLVEDGLRKVHEGLTTLEEAARRISPPFPHGSGRRTRS